jgi:hypothetical protein
MDEVTVDIDMFCTLIKRMIFGNINCRLVVTVGGKGVETVKRKSSQIYLRHSYHEKGKCPYEK